MTGADPGTRTWKGHPSRRLGVRVLEALAHVTFMSPLGRWGQGGTRHPKLRDRT